jgi:fructosamine-3-kinase
VETFVKRRSAAPPGLFAAEAAGLAWLRVPGGAGVVEVVRVDADAITLERLRPVAPTRAAAQAFGAALAVTHDAGAADFGAAPDGFTGQSYIADLPLTTDPRPAWGRFYAEQRLLPYARQAAAELGPAGWRVIETLARRLADQVFDDAAPPGRLHGDLWNGNLLFTAAGARLIDPSAHGGHRLGDLAMLALFGAPHLEAIFQGYQAASRHLPDNWRALLGLHQVYPLLVHAVLFGAGYAHQAVEAARHYL